MNEKGVSLRRGHTYRFGAHARTTVDGRVPVGVENFCMSRRDTSYAAFPNWQLGFSPVYLELRSGRFQWYPVAIGKKGFVWKGKRYV